MYVATLPWEIKNSNFLQIFSRYRRKCKQIEFWVHRWIPISRDISQTILWVCGLFSGLKTKSLTVSTFSSVRELRSLLLPGHLSTVPVSYNFFDGLLTPLFVQLSQQIRLSTSLLCTPPNINILNQNLILVAEYHAVYEHCSHICWDEFPMPQTDRKSK